MAIRALSVVLASFAVGWVLFFVGYHLSTAAGSMSDESELASDSTIDALPYFTLAAIAIFGACSLLATRMTAPAAQSVERGGLALRVRLIAQAGIITAASLSTFAILVTFMSGFLDTGGSTPLARIFNEYLPIALHTALIISLLLTGFIFSGRSGAQDPAPADDIAPEDRLAELIEDAAPAAAAPVTAPSVAVAAPAAPSALTRETRRFAAWGWSAPIIAAALALLIGLVIYDLTSTSLEAWVWVAILAVVALGVCVGVLAAARGLGSSNSSAIVGAENLGFVLTIVFVIGTMSMSLGFGISAIENRSAYPSLSLSAYADDGEEDGVSGAASSNVSVDLWGEDLKTGTKAAIELSPGNQTLDAATVDQFRTLSASDTLPDSLAAGEYTLTSTATSITGEKLSVKLALSVSEDGRVEFPKGTQDDADEGDLTMPLDAAWFIGDMTPAAVMMLLALGLIATTALTVPKRPLVPAQAPPTSEEMFRPGPREQR